MAEWLGVLEPAIQVVKFVGRPIVRQCNYLCCFTTNIDSLKEEANNLDDALVGLKDKIEEGRDNDQKPVPVVETWITKSEKIKDEISGILDEAKNVGSVCLKLGDRFRLSRRAKKTLENTKEHRGGKPEVEFMARPKAAAQGVQLGKIFECESRNKIEEEIMATLRGGEVNMIGIHGMGGLGKTTMAKRIMNRALKKDQFQNDEKVFEEVVIATVSQIVDISKIQDEIGGQLGLDKLKDEKSEFARAHILLSRLSDEKRRTLVVLDDVWNKPPLESIGIPIDSNADVCTILFTSRNRDVLHDMNVQIFEMKVLSVDEAWSFFREKADTCADDENLNETARQVAKACGGLPINLAAVGEGLRDERRAAIWEHAVTQLKESVPGKVQSDVNYKPLKWSYDRLDSKPAQSIFLLCCLFPEDADIPLQQLTYFCMGLRIFEKEGITYKEAWNWVYNDTNLLKHRSLLLESDGEDCVRMHDVVRVVCTSIAKEEGYIGKYGGSRWISSSHLVEETKEFLSKSRCPNLRLLFLKGRYDDAWGSKVDDAFLEGMRELCVLCIEDYYSFTTLSLGKQINTLILDSCGGLKTVPVVGELVNLQILICRNCRSIEKLPSEVKGLYRLKVLDLTGCWRLQSIERGIISSLVGLEELKMRGSFSKWEERGNARLRELEALTNLACLEINIQNPSLLREKRPLLLNKNIGRFIITTTDSWYGRPAEFRKAMSLGLRETGIRDWMIQLLRDTECLYLMGDGASNVDLAKSRSIRWLKLEKCKSMKNVVRTSGGDDAAVFPLIEHVQLESLPELQEISDGPISSTSFQNLIELKLEYLMALTQFWKSIRSNYIPHFSSLSSIYIRDCHSLRDLGQLSMAGKDCLPQLQQLFIKKCEMMEQVFLWNDIEEGGENKTKVFPKLKEVELYDLPNLTSFYQGIQAIEFPLLKEMIIEECPKMKRIIGSTSADIDDDGSLPHLHRQPQKVSFGSLKVLKVNHNPFGGHEIPSSLFTGLEELTIGQYEGFTLRVARNLVTLRVLCIIDCDEMIKVIKDEQQVASGGEGILLFPKLEELELVNLPKLVGFCNSKCEVELPLLRKVEIKMCPNMESFTMGLVATPNLEAFETDLTTYVGVGVDVAFDTLKELKIFENENPWCSDKICGSLFYGLEKLEFYEYKGSMSLFSSSAVGNLVNLRVLQITFCDEMLVKLIKDDEVEEEDDGKVVVSGGEISTIVFPKLEELYLKYSPKLVSFGEWKCDVEFPSLRKVEISYCPNMESFSMGFVATPNLKIVRFDHQQIDPTKELNGLLQQHYFYRQEGGFEEDAW